MVKPRRKSGLGSLDSLLDTMTSVVGILLIMLIVIQLDVTSAVQRILTEQEDTTTGVSAAQLAAVRRNIEATKRETARISNAVVTARETRDAGSKEAASLRASIADLKIKLAAREKEAASAQQLVAEATRKQKEIETKTKELEAIKSDWQDAKKTFAATPVPKALPSRTITLPDPGAAPEGARPLYVICRAGRVAAIDHEGLQNIVKEELAKAGLKPNGEGEYDGRKFEALFKNRQIGDRDFRIRAIQGSNHRMAFQLYKHGRPAETMAQIRQPTSRYRLLLNRTKPKERYLQFVVWPDGYDAYLLARAYASGRGLVAGWRPSQTKEGWSPWLGTFNTLGFKKAQAAKPPAKPGAPARRPLPVDVVD